MRKKVKILMALFLSLTLMFGSTLCYAAEAEADSNEVYADGQSDGDIELAFFQSGISGYDAVFSEANIKVSYVLQYEWDEGYAGWFTGAVCGDKSVIAGPGMAFAGDFVVDSFGYSFGANGKSITVSMRVYYYGGYHSYSHTYHIDDYGDIS